MKNVFDFSGVIAVLRLEDADGKKFDISMGDSDTVANTVAAVEKNCTEFKAPIKALNVDMVEDMLYNVNPWDIANGACEAKDAVVEVLNRGIKFGIIAGFGPYNECHMFYKVYTEPKKGLEIVDLEKWVKEYEDNIDSYGPPYC